MVSVSFCFRLSSTVQGVLHSPPPAHFTNAPEGLVVHRIFCKVPWETVPHPAKYASIKKVGNVLIDPSTPFVFVSNL
jgi:hypothetical protein